MNNKIKTLSDLYKLLLPALKSKRREMNDLKYIYVTEKDIWNYLKENVWAEISNLTLADMVDDILNIDNDAIGGYIANQIVETRNNSTEN